MEAITGSLEAMAADAVAVATLVLVALVAVYALKFMRKAIGIGGGASGGGLRIDGGYERHNADKYVARMHDGSRY